MRVRTVSFCQGVEHILILNQMSMQRVLNKSGQHTAREGQFS